jgi:hypothetical protein
LQGSIEVVETFLRSRDGGNVLATLEGAWILALKKLEKDGPMDVHPKKKPGITVSFPAKVEDLPSSKYLSFAGKCTIYLANGI